MVMSHYLTIALRGLQYMVIDNIPVKILRLDAHATTVLLNDKDSRLDTTSLLNY